MKKIKPTSDLAFKKTFASEENKDILSGLIKDFFDIVPENLEIANPYSIDICKKFNEGGEDINELRHTLCDITASFKTADFVSELQIKKTRHFSERSLYYPLKRFCDNYNVAGKMKIGTDGKLNRYSSLRPVYALNILDYNHFDEDDDSLRIFELYDPVRNKRFSKELLKIGYFELTKATIETDNQKHWYDFFTSKEISQDAPDYIKKANEVIDFTNLGEEERKVAEALEKAQATIQDELDYSYYEGKTEGKAEGRAEGRAEGKAEGLLEGLLNAAKFMLQKGDKPEDVASGLNLSLEQICKLQSQ